MEGARHYSVFGLVLRAPIALPEFPALPPAAPDIELFLGSEAGAAWEARRGDGAGFHPSDAGGHAMQVPGHAFYRVSDGCRIDMQVLPGADPGLVRLYLIGSAMGMALHQRGLPVLHGATVAHRGGASIIVGETGAGKSTLAAALGRLGHPILGDDTMVPWPAASGWSLRPGSGVFKLWRESIDAFGLPAAGLQEVGNRQDKFFVPNPVPPPDRSVALAEVIVLDWGEDAPVLSDLGRLAAVRALMTHGYRPEFARLLGREDARFRDCAAIAAAVPVRLLRRPRGLERLGEVTGVLRRHWGEPGP